MHLSAVELLRGGGARQSNLDTVKAKVCPFNPYVQHTSLNRMNVKSVMRAPTTVIHFFVVVRFLKTLFCKLQHNYNNSNSLQYFLNPY